MNGCRRQMHPRVAVLFSVIGGILFLPNYKMQNKVGMVAVFSKLCIFTLYIKSVCVYIIYILYIYCGCFFFTPELITREKKVLK